MILRRLPGHAVPIAKACVTLAATAVAGWLWYRRKTTPFPYSLRWALLREPPYLKRERLCQVLAPRPGERILEIGPRETGMFSIPVARLLEPGGTLDVFDVQQDMLNYTLAVAGEQNISNIVVTHGDARRMPYLDGTFDGAFMVAALGEMPNQEADFGELRRVLKAGGRLVVGEFVIDWYEVQLGSFVRDAERQGFSFEGRVGYPISYFARFSASAGDHAPIPKTGGA